MWTRSDFYKLCSQYEQQYGQRKGQAWFNALYTLDPELANMVRGTAVDPFYEDRRVVVAEQLLWGVA